MAEIAPNVFLSYARADNQRGTGKEGWADSFKKELTKRVFPMYRGAQPPRIWRDEEELLESDDLTQAIFTQLRNTAVFVPVLSGSWLRSDWCKRELREFAEAARGGRRLWVEGRLPILKVERVPIPEAEQPEPVRGLRGCQFYRRTAEGHERFESLDPEQADLRDLFLKAVEDVAWGIVDLLERLSGAEAAGPTVFVASTTYDLDGDRQGLCRELRDAGCQVREAGVLSREQLAARARVAEALEGTSLSVHMFGPNYGSGPDDAPQSFSELQYRLAVERANAGLATVLAWVKPGREPEARQRAFLDSLRLAREARGDLIEDSYERLWASLAAALAAERGRRQQSVAGAAATPAAAHELYLIHDDPERQDEQLGEVRRFLGGQIHYTEPLFTGDVGEDERVHDELLRQCDRVLLYSGRSSPSRVVKLVGDIKKACRDVQKRFAKVGVWVRRLDHGHLDEAALRSLFGPGMPLVSRVGQLGQDGVRGFLQQIALS